VLDTNSRLVHDDLQNIHNKIVPNLEDKIFDAARQRTQLELWGGKLNLVIRGQDGNLNE
jgi:hypothetical protein